MATADVAPVAYHTQHHLAWRRVGNCAPSEQVVDRELQHRGIRNPNFILAIAYGRRMRSDPPGLSYIIDVEYERDAADKRRRDRDADWCFRPPTWT